MQRRHLTGCAAALPSSPARMATESEIERARKRENEELKGRRKLDKNHKSFESCKRRSSSSLFAEQPAELRVCHCIVVVFVAELATTTTALLLKPLDQPFPGGQAAVTKSEVRPTPRNTRRWPKLARQRYGTRYKLTATAPTRPVVAVRRTT